MVVCMSYGFPLPVKDIGVFIPIGRTCAAGRDALTCDAVVPTFLKLLVAIVNNYRTVNLLYEISKALAALSTIKPVPRRSPINDTIKYLQKFMTS